MAVALDPPGEASPRPPAHPLLPLLEEAEWRGGMGSDLPSDFSLLCERLSLPPHPRVLRALLAASEQGGGGRSVGLSQWVCEAKTLCALLVLLAAHRVACLKLWACEILEVRASSVPDLSTPLFPSPPSQGKPIYSLLHCAGL